MRKADTFRTWVRLAIAIAVCAITAPASAQPTSDRPASIIVFPKVIANSTYDTTIQVTNTSNMQAYARCVYVDAEPEAVGVPSTPLCSERDFTITLTAQQPTFWVASHGRTASDGIPGTSPGAIPTVPSSSFIGELLCIQTDDAYHPLSGNALIGTATLKHLGSGDASKYNAVGLQGYQTNNADNTLCLGGAVTADCPTGAEYEGCPQYWRLDHYADNATDELAGAGSSVKTELTVVPCTQNLDAQLVTTAIPQFRVENEFEEVLSALGNVTCWSNAALSSIQPFVFAAAYLGTDHAQTRIGTPTEVYPSGIIVMAHEFHEAPGAGIIPVTVTASAAVDVHVEGTHPGGDIIVLPTLLP